MNLADLSKEDWAQIAMAIKAHKPKGAYTKLVESIDQRLANIECMLAKLSSDKNVSVSKTGTVRRSVRNLVVPSNDGEGKQ